MSRYGLLAFHVVLVAVGLILWLRNRRAAPDGPKANYFVKVLGASWACTAALQLWGDVTSLKYAEFPLSPLSWVINVLLHIVGVPLLASFHVWRERYRRPVHLNLSGADRDPR